MRQEEGSGPAPARGCEHSPQTPASPHSPEMHICLWEGAIAWNKLMMKLNGFLSLQFFGMNTNERVVADFKIQKCVPALTQQACPSIYKRRGEPRALLHVEVFHGQRACALDSDKLTWVGHLPVSFTPAQKSTSPELSRTCYSKTSQWVSWGPVCHSALQIDRWCLTSSLNIPGGWLWFLLQENTCTILERLTARAQRKGVSAHLK